MPWNNQNGGDGGWRSGGGGGPWGGQGPGGNQQPDLEEILKRSQDKMKQVMHGGGVPGPLLFLAAAAGILVVGWYAFFFRVNPDEIGVVMRFGEFVREAPPGLHYRLPYPIEEVHLPKVTRQNIIEIGRHTTPGGRSATAGTTDVRAESLMLTGDENIVDIDFVVYWRIKSGKDEKTGEWGVAQYLFNIQNPEITVKEVAESAMREIIGQSNIQPVLTEARQQIEQSVQQLMQETLDSYRAGVQVDQVQMQRVDPPNEVIDAFRDVQAARADNQRLQNEAYAYANRVVPEARGEAERILQAAEGYRQQTVAEANGQTARFLKVYEEYAKAPDVTRRRIFLETMERVFGGTDKIILDNKNGQGVVPYLPLGELQKKAPVPPASPAPTGGN